MNVTQPINTFGTTPTLPIKRNNENTSNGNGNGTPTPPTLPSNPPHLGNTIDTTA